MSRLLFAAARGARVQANYQGTWSGVSGVHLGKTPHEYRIHPEDEHLQYGPISTALRESAKNPPDSLVKMATIELEYMLKYKTGVQPYYMQGKLHRSLFLLIVAEALADEGL